MQHNNIKPDKMDLDVPDQNNKKDDLELDNLLKSLNSLDVTPLENRINQYGSMMFFEAGASQNQPQPSTLNQFHNPKYK